MMAPDALAVTRLLQLASPMLPVGAYSYSQGLESAIETGLVSDEASARVWISDVLCFSIASFEAPLLWRLSGALIEDDYKLFVHWNAQFRSGRETAELRAETLQMGHALRVLMEDLPLTNAVDLKRLNEIAALTFPAAFSFAAHGMGVDRHSALVGYVWSWLENQVMAALKAVPLGQSAGQRLLAELAGNVAEIAQSATTLADDDLSNFAPGLAIASCRHETQYSRLFRS